MTAPEKRFRAALVQLRSGRSVDANLESAEALIRRAARGGADTDRARHAADDKIRVRILAAENRMELGDLTLPRERVQVMRDRHEVRLGRQLVSRVTPVGVREDAELA